MPRQRQGAAVTRWHVGENPTLYWCPSAGLSAHTSLPEHFARELRLYSVRICLPEYERDGLISLSVSKANISYLELIWHTAVRIK